MPTDEERRDVARRLRAIEPDDFSSYSEEHECVENILGIWDDYDKFLWRVVADLIEPDSTIPTDPGEAALASVEGFIREMRHSTEEEQNRYSAMLKKMSVELYPVDRDALLEIVQAMDSRGKCASEENGGDGKVDAWWLSQYAHLIREALGVES